MATSFTQIRKTNTAFCREELKYSTEAATEAYEVTLLSLASVKNVIKSFYLLLDVFPEHEISYHLCHKGNSLAVNLQGATEFSGCRVLSTDVKKELSRSFAATQTRLCLHSKQRPM
jgi:hypothetical protein